MKTLDIVIATNNPNKVREYKELFEVDNSAIHTP